jgi:beta-1,3-galactosyltransferase
MVNEELWNEAHAYGDIQVLPFVDYYSLITWKTLAICIYGVNTIIIKLKLLHSQLLVFHCAYL